MTVLLAGASGAIGTALVSSLRGDNEQVRLLVRREARHPDEVSWRPDRGELDRTALQGVDAVVCLSGANVGEHRWSDEYKQQLRSSRIDPVTTLSKAINESAAPPAVFICASAVGYYGDTAEQIVDESAPAGHTFLAELCQDWEAAAQTVTASTVIRIRTGLVLDRHSGLLAKLVPLFQLGLGGRIGSGKQYFPWISLTDEIAAIRFLLGKGLTNNSTVEQLAGAYNLTGPHPVTNAEFAAALGRAVHRPALLPVPGAAIRLALGEFAQDVLTGQRAVPHALQNAGFTHQHDTIDAALTAIL